LTLSEPEDMNCLRELGAEYFRVGAEHCKQLEDGSQLSAFLFLGIRAISIAQGFPMLVSSHLLDTFDAARRAFLESNYLQIEFRLKESADKAKRWLGGENGTWKTKFKKWEEAILTPGPVVFGREYGDFSEIAHPTFSACQNSAAVLTHLLGISAEKEKFDSALVEVSTDIPATLFRLTWITFATDERFIQLPIDKSHLSKCVKFHDNYYRLRTEEQKK
jgi:hypothetical protein